MENESIQLINTFSYIIRKNKSFKLALALMSFILFFVLLLLYFYFSRKFKIIKNEYSYKLSLAKTNYHKELSKLEINYYHRLLRKKEEYSHKIIDIKKENSIKKSKIKTEYLNKILYYKNLLKLYIENRTAFYIKGREKITANKYNDSNIITLQDKLNWLTIHDNPELKSKYADKILLHNFSIEILGKDICVPIIKIYNSIDEIDLNELPDKFVLKCNHGSGMNIICKNKKKLDLEKSKKMLKDWMNINYGLLNFEYQYINIQKKVYAEQYLCDNILDYKFYCFNGIPKFIRVQRHLNHIKINNYYNLDWTLNEIETNLKPYVRRPDIKYKKPKYLELMIEYAKKLSANFTFVRVDLYEVNDKVYLGELTFTPFNALMHYKDRNQSIYLGKLLDICKKT